MKIEQLITLCIFLASQFCMAQPSSNDGERFLHTQRVFLRNESKKVFNVSISYKAHFFSKLDSHLAMITFGEKDYSYMQALDEFLKKNSVSYVDRTEKIPNTRFSVIEERYEVGKYISIRCTHPEGGSLSSKLKDDYVTYDLRQDKIIEAKDLLNAEGMDLLVQRKLNVSDCLGILLTPKGFALVFPKTTITLHLGDELVRYSSDYALDLIGTSRGAISDIMETITSAETQFMDSIQNVRKKVQNPFEQYNIVKIEKMVNLSTPGSLAGMLSTEEKENVTKLVVTGKIDARDVALIRRMLGADDDIAAACGKAGSLISLDLSGAEFVESDHTYYIEDGNGLAVSRTLNVIAPRASYYDNRVELVFYENATPKDWRLFKSVMRKYYKGDDFICRYDEKTKKIDIMCLINSSAVSRNMFYGCCNLREIILPERVKSIGIRAFGECARLEYIDLPKKVNKIYGRAFEYSKSIKRVNVHYDKIQFSRDVYDIQNWAAPLNSIFTGGPAYLQGLITNNGKEVEIEK